MRVKRAALQEDFPGWGRRVLSAPNQGVIYVKNAKAGTSTVTLWLHRIHTGDEAFTPERSIHNEHALPRAADIGWRATAAMLSGDAFRFTFVRHPIRRAESAYRDKVLRKRNFSGRLALQRRLGLPVGCEHDLTAEQFVTALEEQEPGEMDAHWRPQWVNTLWPHVEYEVVGRLETFAEDVARIRAAANLPRVPIEVRNSRHYDVGLFTTTQQKRLAAVYERDFDLFDYSP